MSASSRIITCGIAEDMIARVLRYIEERHLRAGGDLSRLAVVFGGRRPSMFLQRSLAAKTGGAFFPPRFFSMDEFMLMVAQKKYSFAPLSEFDSWYCIYTLAQALAPDIVNGRHSFAEFLPWAQEILSFIEQVDIEKISEGTLESVERNAAIGYDVPASVNTLLRHIGRIRDGYHAYLAEKRRSSRGFMYLQASEYAGDIPFNEYDEVLFCGLFYLSATEREVIGDLYRREKATLFFHGDDRDWPILADNARYFGAPIRPGHYIAPQYNLKLYAGFDTHSQAALVREIVRTIEHPDKTVLVVPDADAVVPLLSEIAPLVKDINVSLGYPLRRSSLYSLLEGVFEAQKTRKDDAYRTRDYLRVLRHPLIKNLRLPFDPSVTRVLAHKIEEVLLGIEDSDVGGSIAVRLRDIEGCDRLYAAVRETLARMEIFVKEDEVRRMTAELHRLLFASWETVATFSAFAATLQEFIDLLVRQSFLTAYPLNINVVERLFRMIEEFGGAQFSGERFPPDDLFRIVLDRLSGDMVSFAGSPLKGFQMLGMMEARSLSFENVIMMDVNESVLPKLRIQEPLIPREIMIGLGLRRFEKEEEIQRYGFMRLVSSAKNVHLVYSEDKKREKSRFIEELVWERQKKAGALETVPIARGGFRAKIAADKLSRAKTPEVAAYLKEMRYSATRLDTYLQCPMKFYFQYVLGMREKEDLTDEPDGAEIGTFIHGLLHDAFKRFAGRAPVIDDRFVQHFKARLEESFAGTLARQMKSDAFMVKEIIEHRLQHFLKEESARAVKEVVALEATFNGTVTGDGLSSAFEARVDRIDRLDDGTLLIIDYKTGSADLLPRSLKTLQAMPMDRVSIRDGVCSFQLPLYVHLVGQRYAGETVDAALYNLRTATLSRYFKEQDEESRKLRMDLCMKSLAHIIKEINDPAVPFIADDRQRDRCAACPFFYSCR